MIVKGMGWAVSDNVPGYNNACGSSYLSFLMDPFCWGSSFSDWEQAYNGQSLLTTVAGTAGGGNVFTNADTCSSSFGISCPMAIAAALGLVLLLRR